MTVTKGCIHYYDDGKKRLAWSLGLVEDAIETRNEPWSHETIDDFSNTNMIDLFELLYKEASASYYYSCERTRKFNIAYSLYEIYPEIQEKYLFTGAYKIADRFILKTKGMTSAKHHFNDGINYDVPYYGGLYFIGETHFNPYTKEEFYWVKIGKSSNLAKRMKQYNTCCPMLWRIDFEIDAEELEGHYHNWLYEHCEAICNHNEEWFLVNRETYLEMCEKGFAYFD